ncbi:MAG TPA: CDP-alcohol phosphatidyltransferase family protein [Gemmatimonadales bacterium]|nr:CDP-alcohol phosphatidyltransferase family protein [Gemmatimonadales bacterium]
MYVRSWQIPAARVTQGSPAPRAEQERPRWSAADLLTALRVPLAVAFPLASTPEARLAIVVAAAGTDLLDGRLARRFGGSRLGAVLDPIADKLFIATAFAVVLLSGRLAWYEVAGALVRDIVATAAFAATAFAHAPSAIPARVGGKAVTIAQLLTLVAFCLDSPLIHPLAWASAAVGLFAIWDYSRVASRDKRTLKQGF